MNAHITVMIIVCFILKILFQKLQISLNIPQEERLVQFLQMHEISLA
jgi:hypothetical protein